MSTLILPPLKPSSGLDWIDLRLVDGGTPVDPEGMLRVPITETDGLFEVDFLNDSGGTVNFRFTGDFVRIDFGAVADLFPTGPRVGIAVQFYDIELVSRNVIRPTVVLGFATEGIFNGVAPGFQISSSSNTSVDDPRVWPAALGFTSPLVNSKPSGANAMQAQGSAYATLPTGRGVAWSANDTVLVDASAGSGSTHDRFILFLGGNANANNLEAAKFRFRCRYAVEPPLEDFPS